MSTRTEMALEYGLEPDASWDDIYLRWKHQWSLRTHLPRIFICAGAVPSLLLLLSQHWLMIVAAAVLFLLSLAVLILGFYFSMEDQYFGLLGRAPQILERAKRDGVYR